MKEIVFNDKAIEFFKGEQKKTLDDIAVTVVHKDTLKNKNKVINDLLSKISDLEFEVEKQEQRIDKAIEYIKEKYITFFDNVNPLILLDKEDFNKILNILKGVDKE